MLNITKDLNETTVRVYTYYTFSEVSHLEGSEMTMNGLDLVKTTTPVSDHKFMTYEDVVIKTPMTTSEIKAVTVKFETEMKNYELENGSEFNDARSAKREELWGKYPNQSYNGVKCNVIINFRGSKVVPQVRWYIDGKASNLKKAVERIG